MADSPTHQGTSSTSHHDYWCFISYRHADNKAQDRDWASWLHQEIERYEVPAELVGTENERGDLIPERIYPVFRDEESLPADADLGSSIVNALDRSKFLVVLCSPRAVESTYVADEIHHFKKSEKGDRIIAAILAGEPGDAEQECFPAPLKHPIAPDGALNIAIEDEPIAADFRLRDDSEGYTSAEAYKLALLKDPDVSRRQAKRWAEAYDGKLQLMKLKIIAGILGVPLETLRDRDQAYQLELARKRARIFRQVAATMGFLMISAVVAGLIAMGQRNLAQANELRASIEAGEGWLLRAEDRKGSTSEAFLAARAVGFEGFGKALDPRTGSLWGSLQSPWNQLVGIEERTEWFPRLLTAADSLKKSNQAMIMAELASSRSFMWSSPVAAQHASPISGGAWSPDGKTLATCSTDGVIKLWNVEAGNELASVQAHSDSTYCVAWSPDGQRFATGSADNSIKLWDAGSRLEMATLRGHTHFVSSVVWSPNGEILASGSGDGIVLIWDVEREATIATLSEHTGGINSVAWSPDGKLLATGSGDYTVKLWDTVNWEAKATLRGHNFMVNCIAWSPDGKYLASGSIDETIKIWDAKSGEIRENLSVTPPIESLAWSPDGKDLASADSAAVRLWDAENWELKALMQGHIGKVNSVTWSPDGTTIASASDDGTVKLWNARTGKHNSQQSGHSSAIRSVDWSPDGMSFATGSDDRQVLIWNAPTGEIRMRLGEHDHAIKVLAWSPDGSTIATCDGVVRLWNANSGELVDTLSVPSETVAAVAWSPDGKTLAGGTGSPDEGIFASEATNLIVLWDMPTGRVKKSWRGHRFGTRRVMWSPDGETLATCAFIESTVKVWDVESGELKATFGGHTEEVTNAAWNPRGPDAGLFLVQRLLATSSGQTVRILNVETGQTVTEWEQPDTINALDWSPDGETLAASLADGTVSLWPGRENLMGHSGEVHCLAWSPDGATLATGSSDCTVKLWNAQRGDEKATLVKSHIGINSVAWSPDGETLAIGPSRNSAKLWDVQSGEQKAELGEHSGNVTQVAWSPDGATLASVSFDGTVKLWDAQSGKQHLSWENSNLINSVAWSPSEELASGVGTTIKVWDVRRGHEVASLTGHINVVRSVAWSPDGLTIASSEFEGIGSNHAVRLWNVRRQRQKAMFFGHAGTVNSVALSPDGRTLATGSDDTTAKLWDPQKGKERASLEGHSAPVTSVAFSADGETLATGSRDQTIKLWDAKSGEHRATLRGHKHSINTIAWNHDGNTLASGSDLLTVKLWDISPGRANLYVYLEEGLCGFDEETHELSWAEPKRNLYRGIKTAFRNVPSNSSLGILMRPPEELPSGENNRRTLLCLPSKPIADEERLWLLYLKVMEAGNWSSAEMFFYPKLTAERQTWANAIVVWAVAEVIPEQIDAALENGFVKLAEMRLASAKVFAAKLPEEHRVHFKNLERKIAEAKGS